MEQLLQLILNTINRGESEMKYPYSFKRGPHGFLMIELPKEIELFSDFIEQIALEEEADEFIDIIDKVIDGTHDEYEIFFNAPTVTIKPDFTTVFNEFLIDPPFEQTIETKEFRKLILIWKESL